MGTLTWYSKNRSDVSHPGKRRTDMSYINALAG